MSGHAASLRRRQLPNQWHLFDDFEDLAFYIATWYVVFQRMGHSLNCSKTNIIITWGSRNVAKQHRQRRTLNKHEVHALGVCRRLSSSELSIGDLGRAPELLNYVMLRDVAARVLATAAGRMRYSRGNGPRPATQSFRG